MVLNPIKELGKLYYLVFGFVFYENISIVSVVPFIWKSQTPLEILILFTLM